MVPLPRLRRRGVRRLERGSSVGTVAATGGFVVLVPIAAGLSITRYHLYDVERILARTTTYVAAHACC